MSSHQNLSNDSEDLCVVCFKEVELYSIGICDHPVCYECSTRMRVLCKQQECPICRGEMPEVIFTREKKLFKELQPNRNLVESKYGVLFCSRSLQDAYYSLLEFNCDKCHRVFRNFQQLKEHMRKEHELHYCDLCVENLKIFAFERRCYNRSDLATHRRRGDDDNKSHRGHPLCKFCDQRYMDNDDLFRHLRRDHLYCHFCDADGKHQYYPSYDELRVHFLQDHYLCEEGDCKNEQFTSVFRTDIDYKAHIAMVHSKHLSRGAAKQARTLELAFNFKPRPNVEYRQNNYRNKRTAQPEEEEEGAIGYDEPGGSRPQQRPLTSSDFPTLRSSSDASHVPARTSVTFTSKMSKPKFNNEEFPSLGGASAAAVAATPRTSVAVTKPKKTDITITKTSTGSARSTAVAAGSSRNYGRSLTMNSQNFPTLAGENGGSNSSMVKLTMQERPQRSNVSIHVNHNHNAGNANVSASTSIQVRPKSTAEAFPALGGSLQPAPEAHQWVMPKTRKAQEPKVAKVAKPPVLPPSSLSDFPSLSKKEEKKSSSVIMPIASNRQEANNNEALNNANNNKKDAKKETKKKENVNVKEKEMKEKEKDKQNNTDGDKSKNNKNKKKNKNENMSEEIAALLSSPASYITDANTRSETETVNSIVKKTSTLKIGTLELPPEERHVRPPGISMKPPPGFIASSYNDLTFTSSSGQSYSIVPNNNQPVYTYAQPANFQNRNSNLIRNFISILKTKERLNEFKSYSDLFRQGTYPPDKYYAHCQLVLGEMFGTIFPELLVLLPDISKQIELYRVHRLRGSTNNLNQCATCKQVIFGYELKYHLNSHYMENHFPTLAADIGANAWRGK